VAVEIHSPYLLPQDVVRQFVLAIDRNLVEIVKMSDSGRVYPQNQAKKRKNVGSPSLVLLEN
jgi:hypothetical protein